MLELNVYRECNKNALLQLTLVNTDYLRAVTSSGDEWRLSAVYLPSVVRSVLRRLTRLVGDLALSMQLLADADCGAVDRWRHQLDYPPDFRCLGFSGWLANNDTVDKADVMSELAGTPLNISLVTVIYAVLSGCPDLLHNASCLYFDDDNSTFSSTPISDFVRALFEVRSENFTCDEVATMDTITAALCHNSADASSCFAFPTDRRLSAAYIRVLSAYVTVHLAAYVFHRAVILAGNDLVVTRPQSRLALGDGYRSSVILEHYVDAASASNNSHLVTVYNCYDAIHAVSNGHWECKWFAHVRLFY